MKTTRCAVTLLLLILLLGAGAAVLLLRPDQRPLTPVRIERTHHDPQALLLRVSVDERGAVYAVEWANGKHYYQAFSSRGRSLWRVEDRRNANCSQALVSLPGPRQAPLGRYVGKGGMWDSRTGNDVWVSVGQGGEISSRVLDGTRRIGFEIVAGTQTRTALYAVGGTDQGYPVAAAFDHQGRRRWVRSGERQGFYEHAAVAVGDGLITSFSPDGMGVFITSYSRGGRLLWSKELIRTRDSASLVWLGTRRHDSTFALVRLHETIGLRSEAQARGLIRQGSKHVIIHGTGQYDESGRDQDHILLACEPDGERLRKTLISHGAWLSLEDAAVNGEGDMYFAGNRQKVNRYGFPVAPDGAQVIKCDPRGRIVWSRRVTIPKGCSVQGITLGEKSGVYIYGDSRDYNSPKPKSPSRQFIYEVASG